MRQTPHSKQHYYTNTTKKTQPSMTDSAPTREMMITWFEENLPLLAEEKQGQIKAALDLGDALPDIAVSGIYDAAVAEAEGALAEFKAAKAIAEKEEEIFQKGLDKYEEWDDAQEWVVEKKGVKKKGQSEATTTYIIKDKRLACLLLSVIKDEKKEAKRLANPKKTKGGKKTSGTRRKAGDTDEWIKNTEEEAKAEYKTGKWACKTDIENQSLYKDNMKVYKVGVADPRDPNDGELTKDLTKYQFKAPVRTDAIQDEADNTRCRGAIGWKSGRYGCQFAADKGFKGAVMAQCSEKVKDGGMCSKCAKNGVDYFNKDNKYVKAGIAWCEAFGDEFVKI